MYDSWGLLKEEFSNTGSTCLDDVLMFRHDVLIMGVPWEIPLLVIAVLSRFFQS